MQVLLAILLLLPLYNMDIRRIHTPPWMEFLERKDRTINEMVKGIMESERGKKLIEDIRNRLPKPLNLPLEISNIMVPAGRGFEYRVDITIFKPNKRGKAFICISIWGDLEPEGFSPDPSCWDRGKVVRRCVIEALKACGLRIEKVRNQEAKDPFWYDYYYCPPPSSASPKNSR